MFSKRILWQGLTEDLAEDFLSYFYPEHIHLLDYERGFEFSQVPLGRAETVYLGENKPLFQLLTGYQHNGTAIRFLIYIDLLGSPPSDLGKMLFHTASRVLKRYGDTLNTLVVYLGPPNELHVAEYFQEFWKGAILFSFLTYELFEKSAEELLTHPSLISLVLAAAQVPPQTPDGEQFQSKRDLIRTLFSRDYPVWKIRRVLHFIRFYHPFTQAQYDRNLVETIRQENPGGIAMGMEVHMLRELEEHMMDKGIKQGRIQEKRTAAWNLLFSPDFQTGSISLDLISNVTGLSKEEIEELYRGMEG